MRPDDSEPLLRVFGDERVMAMFHRGPFDREEMARWVARNLEHQDRHGYGLFTVVEKETGEVIGDCGLEHMDIGAELGYDLRSDRWGRGLATEAALGVRAFAFDRLVLPKLVSLIRVGNVASRRVSEKVGMTLEAESVRGGVRYWVFAIERPRLG